MTNIKSTNHIENSNFIARFHQNVEKQRQKACHEGCIKNKQFTVGGLVLIYDNKYFKHPGKLKIHWLGPYVVKEITNGGPVKLEKLDGMEVRGIINGIRLKLYFDNDD